MNRLTFLRFLFVFNSLSNDSKSILFDSLNLKSFQNNIVEDTTPQLGGDLDVQSNKITTATSNGNVKIEPNGTGVVEIRGAGGYDGTLQLNCSQQSHGIKLKSPAHSAGQSYTLTFPTSLTNNGVLTTNSSGTLSAGLLGTANIAGDAVDGTKIADDSIDSEHYVDGSIDTAHIANDATNLSRPGWGVEFASAAPMCFR